MKYSKGKAGPVSMNELEITSVLHCGSGSMAYARGEALLRKANGDIKGVTFMVQGSNYQFHRERLVPGHKLRVPVRWTGSGAVTIVDTKALDTFRAATSAAASLDAA
ncbi:hypothetical protein [Sphingomonas sp. 3-13AW]|uniref:hypothetical protein n=1 Tax=Sphingomonas sp. 3-13AW TaxID=3050450 RepID=UPI003BB6A979